MKIENKEMLLYSAQKAVNAVCRIGGGYADEKEAYFAVGCDCMRRNRILGAPLASLIAAARSRYGSVAPVPLWV